MAKQQPILTVGSLNMDQVVQVERLPVMGETLLGAGSLKMVPGGKGANQAIGARRLGTDVLFVTRLGADVFGDEARSILDAEDLPDRGITTTDHSPTGVALILVDDVGQNAISVAPGANIELSAPEVIARFGPDLSSARYLLMQLECTAELAVVRACRSCWRLTLLRPTPAMRPSSWAATIAASWSSKRSSTRPSPGRRRLTAASWPACRLRRFSSMPARNCSRLTAPLSVPATATLLTMGSQSG